jgi:hypothetical protein
MCHIRHLVYIVTEAAYNVGSATTFPQNQKTSSKD